MSLENFKINTIRTFVPSKDYSISRDFYKKLGFEETYYSESLAVFQSGDFSFYLQNYYQKNWADNFMLLMAVDDVDAFWEYVQSLNLETEFSGIRFRAPKTEDWGREFHMIDPAGVLWHFAKFAD